MKTIKSRIAFFLFACWCSLSAVGQNTKTITFNFNESDFELYNDNHNNIIINSTNHLATYSEDTTAPGLPYISKNILIKSTQTYKDLSFSIGEKIKVKSNVVVAPNPEVCFTNINITEQERKYQSPIYKEVKYPSAEIEYSGTYKMDGYNILTLNISPFIYDAKNKDLYLVKSFTVNISFNENIKLSLATRSNRTGLVMHDVVKELVDNPNEFESLYTSTKQTNSLKTLGYTDDSVEYLLITNENLTEAFTPLVEWKKEKGVTAKIITTEYINSHYTGTTTQLKIKNCLKDYYENKGLKYVLLGGDDTVVPVMGCYANVFNVHIDSKMPTDLFYACFDNDFEWDANNNGIYGEVEDNIDMAPEIFISRVPVRNIDDTNSFVNKITNYEQFINIPKWGNRLLMCGVKTDTAKVVEGKFVSDTQTKSENMYDLYIKNYWNGARIRFYDTDTDFPNGANYDCNSVNFQEQFSQGYNFIDIMSHGNENSFHLEGDFFDVDKALNLYNKSPKVITTTACSTNAFDHKFCEPCLSESFIRNENNGVIAYLGCSRAGLGLKMFFLLGASESYDGAFYKSLFKDNTGSKKFGEAVALAKISFLNSCQKNDPYRWVLFGLNPIGDPEMPIYTQTPKDFNSATFCFDNDKLTVNTGVDDCRICVMSSDFGKKYYKVISNVQTATFADLPDGEIDICITKEGYAPYRYISYMKYIQNETIRNKVTHMYKNSVLIGSDVTDNKEFGPVSIEEGGSLKLKKNENVYIKGEFEVKQGGEFIVEQ